MILMLQTPKLPWNNMFGVAQQDQRIDLAAIQCIILCSHCAVAAPVYQPPIPSPLFALTQPPMRRCEVAQADFGHLALPTAGKSMAMAMAPASAGTGRKMLGSLGSL